MVFHVTPETKKRFDEAELMASEKKKKKRLKQLEAKVKELEEQNCLLREKFVNMVCGTEEQKSLLITEYRLSLNTECSIWNIKPSNETASN